MSARPRELTAERARELLDYDPETGRVTRRLAFAGGLAAGRSADHLRNHGYAVVTVGERVYRAHRLIWLIVHGHWPLGEIDHINGVRDDNRLANLRDVPKYLNGHNRGPSRTSKSGVKGVAPRRNGTWEAAIQVNKQRLRLGTFKTIEEAAGAYRAAARELVGISRQS